MNRKISIECSDVLEFPCDVLVLKYAQDFYGADGAAAKALSTSAQKPLNISPNPGEYVFLQSNGKIAARNVLFVGVTDLYNFEYKQIREFAFLSMQILAKEYTDVKHIAMTMHGVGY